MAGSYLKIWQGGPHYISNTVSAMCQDEDVQLCRISDSAADRMAPEYGLRLARVSVDTH